MERGLNPSSAGHQNESTMVELYKTIFETWRFQVNSYWQRSGYFAAFETAAIAGGWYLIAVERPPQYGASALLSGLGILLTLLWLANNHKTHKYVDYWWKALEKIEPRLDLPSLGTDLTYYALVSRHTGSGLRWLPYRCLVQTISALFGVAWVCLFIWSLWCVWHCGQVKVETPYGYVVLLLVGGTTLLPRSR